jgi:hypothetical protein
MTNTQGLREALAEARRAIGDHFAPGDCYATGPLTGDAYRDLVECPACSFIAMHDALLALPSPRSREGDEADREMIDSLIVDLFCEGRKVEVALAGNPIVCDRLMERIHVVAQAAMERQAARVAPPLGGGDEDQDDIPGRAAMRGTTASHPEMSEVAGTAFIVMLRATDYDGSDWPLSVHWSEASAEARIQHLTEAQAAISKGQPELVMGADGLPTDASWAKLERWQKRAAAAYKTRTGEVIEPHEIGSHRWFIAPMPLFPETSEAADGVGRDPRPTGQLRDVPKSTPPTTQHGEG